MFDMECNHPYFVGGGGGINRTICIKFPHSQENITHFHNRPISGAKHVKSIESLMHAYVTRVAHTCLSLESLMHAYVTIVAHTCLSIVAHTCLCH